MEFTGIPTEQTTAATDVLLAAVALGCAALIPVRPPSTFKACIWIAAFVLLAFAASLGAVIHGFHLENATRRSLWQPLHLALGLTVALFIVAAVADRCGEATGRRMLPAMLTVGVAFFVATRWLPGGFALFTAYEAIAMGVALGMYLSLAIGGRLPGAWWMVAGVLLSIAAAGVQASRAVRFTLLWEFDHNGVFHLVQVVSLLALLIGVRAALAVPSQSQQPASELPIEVQRASREILR